MSKEIFKIFKDNRHHPNGALWEVSNYGRVRKNGEDYIPYVGTYNYLRFGCRFKLHQAVAELFVPNPEHKKTVDHKNRNRQDNRACNLRWATPKEQAANRDNESISKANLGNKRALGYKHSEEEKAKMRAAMIGNKNGLGYRHSEERKAKIGAAHLGRIWVFNPSTEQSARINSSQLPDYLTKGYVRGRESKVWVFNPTTEHSTLVTPSQLPEYLDKGYIRGRKIKK